MQNANNLEVLSISSRGSTTGGEPKQVKQMVRRKMLSVDTQLDDDIPRMIDGTYCDDFT